MLLNRGANSFRADRGVVCERDPERIVDRILAVTRRHLQDLQILADGGLLRAFLTQPIVGHAKMAGGKQVFTVHVAGERPRLTNQRIDNVPVVDAVFTGSHQTRHDLNLLASEPYFNGIHIDQRIDLVADQATVNRVGVPFHLNRATATYPDSSDPSSVINSMGREFSQFRPLFL